MKSPALSRFAREFAAEIAAHDWSDAPHRIDRAGHNREGDRTQAEQLSPVETARVQTNVMWVTAQVLSYSDPNFDVHAFAFASGVPRSITHTKHGACSGVITAGIRERDGEVCIPGSWDA